MVSFLERERDEAERIAPEQLIAVAYRLAMLRSVRAVAGLGLMLVGGIALLQHSWVVIAAGVMAAWAVSYVMSINAAKKVERLTRLSHRLQERIWDRYRNDPVYAMRVSLALEAGRLADAIEAVTRPIGVEEALDRINKLMETPHPKV